MIHYSLTCDQEHEFEGWFRSSADFDAQNDKGFVACPICASAKIARGLMAPNVQQGRTKDAREDSQRQAAAEKKQTVMLPDPRQKALIEAMAEIRRQVTADADYVGDRFAEEARKMHHGEAEHRGIYGEATADEAKALADEGIEFHALPVLPGDRN